MSRYWVLLADPTDYGWDDLVREGSTTWDGIRNARAQAYLRESQPGDPTLIYHTAPDKAIVGTARITSPPRDKDGATVVTVEAVHALTRRLPLAELKGDGVLSGMSFVKMPRVAVQPVTEEQWQRVMQLSGTDLGASESLDPGDVGGP